MTVFRLAKDLELPARAVTEKFAFLGRTGCHASGQLLLMSDGTLRAVERLDVGDRLMGPDSEPRTIHSLIRGRGELVRIVPHRAGSPFVVNMDHVLTLVRIRDRVWKRKGGSNKVPTDEWRDEAIVDVTVRDYLTWSKHKRHLHKLFRVPVRFQEQSEALAIDPYFLGLLLGDGHMKHNVSVTTQDEEILDAVIENARSFGLEARGSTNEFKTCPTYRLTAGNQGGKQNRLMEALRSIGLWGHLSGDKFIPEVYKRASRTDRLEILAGLIDTDGCLSGNCFDYISKSPALAWDVSFVARSLGFRASISVEWKQDQHGTGGMFHRVCISGGIHVVPCRVLRKQPEPRRAEWKSPLRTGFVVEPAGEGDFFGFTLDRDGRYLLDDFTVTHNSGKSFAAQRFAEELLVAKAQVVVLDPGGDWWGLRLLPNGKPSGFDLPVFGGLHGDLPLEPGSGRLLADLVAERGISAVLDVSMMRKGQRKEFATDFAEELFQRVKTTRRPLHLFLEESQVFVPQRLESSEARMLGAFEDLVKLGRKLGIGTSLISQRPQSVNKDVLNQTEVLVCLQLTGTQERKAVMDWVREKGDREDVAGDLPSLAIGEALVWSPSLLRVFKRVQIEAKRTMDTGATPTLGAKRAEARELAPLDLDEIREAMAAVVQRAEENDPKKLRARIEVLELKLRVAAKTTDPKELTDALRDRYLQEGRSNRAEERVQFVEDEYRKLHAWAHGVRDHGIQQANKLADDLRGFEIHDLIGAAKKHERKAPLSPQDKRAARYAALLDPNPVAGVALEDSRPIVMNAVERHIVRIDPNARIHRDIKPEKGSAPVRVLRELKRWHPRRLTATQLATHCGIAPGGSTWRGAAAWNRERGHFDENAEGFALTSAGLLAAGEVPPLDPTNDAILSAWSSKLGGIARRMFDALVEVRPNPFTAASLAKRVDAKPGGSTWRGGMAKLRANDLIDESGGQIGLAPALFLHETEARERR